MFEDPRDEALGGDGTECDGAVVIEVGRACFLEDDSVRQAGPDLI